jgi:A/G-specific adenine glycosylase
MAPALQTALGRWYGERARDLPWRATRRSRRPQAPEPYHVLVSETMLQQTRVATVVPYFERFVRELPTVHALAEATEERVLALWSGLGYYRRARLLHAAAQQVAREHGGHIPDDPEALAGLAGVGRYTAGAVASIAFGRPVPLVDGNVARVLARLFAVEQDVKAGRGRALMWDIAERLVARRVPGVAPGDWNQALMELGATVCVPRAPRCDECPVRRFCKARARGIQGELPRTTPKRAPLTIRRVALVLASPHRVLLARRRVRTSPGSRSGGLFGGLWEPPMGATAEELASALGIARRSLAPAGEVVHVLTHRRMVVTVMRGKLPATRSAPWPLPSPEYDAVEAVAFDALAKRAHATLARKVLAVAVAKVPARGLGSSP